ncbi:hypothetical protein [Streptomyces sp. NBC_00388]|uniref:hypothetical protein n=1 Tax=Streptomyces sp. NBC_00388 TaxID=2975735 RepID=UPI002E218764
MTLTKKLFATAALVVAAAAASAAPALADVHATATGAASLHADTTVGPDNGHITAAPAEYRAR